MKFDSLTSSKFKSHILKSPELLRITGGKEYLTEATMNGERHTDNNVPHCTGDLYDIDSFFGKERFDAFQEKEPRDGIVYF